jgi:hypothetical protein
MRTRKRSWTIRRRFAADCPKVRLSVGFTLDYGRARLWQALRRCADFVVEVAPLGSGTVQTNVSPFCHGMKDYCAQNSVKAIGGWRRKVARELIGQDVAARNMRSRLSRSVRDECSGLGEPVGSDLIAAVLWSTASNDGDAAILVNCSLRRSTPECAPAVDVFNAVHDVACGTEIVDRFGTGLQIVVVDDDETTGQEPIVK